MEFIWDPTKSQDCLRRRGIDFVAAARIFQGRTLEQHDRRRNYGEIRVIAIGLVEGVILTVVYTDRHTAAGTISRRIISARRSNDRERQAYRQAIQRGQAEGGP